MVPISAVRIADIPLMPNRATGWDDDGTGPDVSVEIQNTSASPARRSADGRPERRAPPPPGRDDGATDRAKQKGDF